MMQEVDAGGRCAMCIGVNVLISAGRLECTVNCNNSKLLDVAGVQPFHNNGVLVKLVLCFYPQWFFLFPVKYQTLIWKSFCIHYKILDLNESSMLFMCGS